MTTAKLTLEYDGTRFAGWAAQPGRRTVQSVLERALATIGRRDVAVTAAGRTDAGVHALGQVVSFEGEPPALRALNGVLPADVKATAAEVAPDGFDARRDAVSRSYVYRLHTRRAGSSPFLEHRALWWPHRLDEDALRACAAAITGRHDFTAFTPSQTGHVYFHRTVLAAEWRREGEMLEFAIEADAFMRHMNRVLVGTMLEVAGGRRAPEDFAALLQGAPRSAAGVTAPAHGLYLVAARYA